MKECPSVLLFYVDSVSATEITQVVRHQFVFTRLFFRRFNRLFHCALDLVRTAIDDDARSGAAAHGDRVEEKGEDRISGEDVIGRIHREVADHELVVIVDAVDVSGLDCVVGVHEFDFISAHNNSFKFCAKSEIKLRRNDASFSSHGKPHVSLT